MKNSEDTPGAFPAPDVVPSNRNNPSSSSSGRNRNMMIADLYLHVYANARNNLSNPSGGNISSVGNPVTGWRCPACQFVVKTGVPKEYKCFCGKLTQPEFIPGDIPHTCGEVHYFLCSLHLTQNVILFW